MEYEGEKAGPQDLLLLGEPRDEGMGCSVGR